MEAKLPDWRPNHSQAILGKDVLGQWGSSVMAWKNWGFALF